MTVFTALTAERHPLSQDLWLLLPLGAVIELQKDGLTNSHVVRALDQIAMESALQEAFVKLPMNWDQSDNILTWILMRPVKHTTIHTVPSPIAFIWDRWWDHVNGPFEKYRIVKQALLELGIDSHEMHRYAVYLRIFCGQDATWARLNFPSSLHNAILPPCIRLLQLLLSSSLNYTVVLVQTTTDLRIHHCQFRNKSSKHLSPQQNAYFWQIWP